MTKRIPYLQIAMIAALLAAVFCREEMKGTDELITDCDNILNYNLVRRCA